MLAKKEKVDIIFHPSEKEMYSMSFLTYVTTRQLPDGLCGLFRPGHFPGVTTVVSKLLNIVAPDVLYLGQKDLQQAVILKKMVEDLNFPSKVKICPTIRESDGLAFSSRNTYLSHEQHQAAGVLYQALQKAKKLIQKGERKTSVIIQTVEAVIQSSPQAGKIDYVACVGADTLEPLTILKGKVAIALAVWFGKTRLLDNTIITIK
jgi:pantoate--beta-alanine ligase